METGTVFALFYAIVFGGTLNRVLVWSAFWASTPEEDRGRWVRRVKHSLVAFTVAPAAYFGFVVHYFGAMPIPQGLVATIIWAIAIFLSVLFLISCYRYWVAIVLRKGIAPLNNDNPLARLTAFPPENYVRGATFALAQAVVGLLLLFTMRYGLPFVLMRVCQQ